jgi:hypothetical protein
MEEQNLPAHTFEPGELVAYDDLRATILERIPSDRAATDDYLVQWADGSTSVVWGSDLVRADTPLEG